MLEGEDCRLQIESFWHRMTELEALDQWKAALVETQSKLIALAKAIEEEESKAHLLEKVADVLEHCARLHNRDAAS